ncbi:MAG: hypothetical protein MJA31_07930, partial [Clostridia bacterium]|nr:hypothetical protein [Clostridia bacterium]
MKFSKRLLVLLLSLVLILAVFAGCTDKEASKETSEPQKTEAKKTEPKKTEEKEEEPKEDTIEPITFTAFTTH